MPELVGSILIVAALVVAASAATLIGALIAILVPDHSNPVAHRWIRWYEKHHGQRNSAPTP